MNLIIILMALVALGLLVYSVWLDDSRHVWCNCPPEEDPSHVWYPIRWGLIAIQAMVVMSNAVYFAGDIHRLEISYMKDFSVTALGITYALTLINPKWSVTILVEAFTLRIKTWLMRN